MSSEKTTDDKKPANRREIPAIEDLLRPFHEALERHKINYDIIAKTARNGLLAKRTEKAKMKGAVDLPKTPKGNLRKGYRAFTSGVIEQNEDGKSYGTGETLVLIDMVDNAERRKMAQLVAGWYGLTPAAEFRVKHSGPDGGPIETETTFIQQLMEDAKGATRGLPNRDPNESVEG